MPHAPRWLLPSLALLSLPICSGLAPPARRWPQQQEEAPPPAQLLEDGVERHWSPFDSRIESAGRPPRGPHRDGRSGLPAAAVAPSVALPLLERLHGLRWLHIPKTGTSFIATIWNYACGQRGLPLDLYVDDWYGPGCGKCYDFALMDRYPRDRYCETGVLSPRFATQHQPAKPDDFSSESVIGFFRRPTQRIISAYKDGMHSSGFDADTRTALWQACQGKGVGCFARYPGIAGCSARMLAGEHCADSSAEVDAGMRFVDEAVANIQKMRFVGLTEEWDESICLFHRMFGGRVNPAEFKDFHPHPGKSEDYDEAELEGFVDKADDLVYQAAVKRFAELKAKYAGGDSACRDMMLSAESGNDSEESQFCGARGVQCGPLDGRLDCGMCPQHRMQGLQTPGAAPTCSHTGHCHSKGLQLDESSVFSWYLDSPPK